MLAAKCFRVILIHPSWGIVNITLPINWRSFTGLSGALLASPFVMNHLDPSDTYVFITRWVIGASAVWYWIMSPGFSVFDGVDIMIVMSPGFSVGCMLPVAIIVGVKPSNPVDDQTAIKPINVMAVQYGS